MKKINYLFFTICLLFLLFSNAKTSLAANYLDASKPLNVKFHAKFVYPDGTAVPASALKLDSKISYAPHFSTSYMSYQMGATEILRSTQEIPSIGNGVYSDSYTSKIIPMKVNNRQNMEGGRVSYSDLFVETEDCIKSITPIQKLGTAKITNNFINGNNPSPTTSGFYMTGLFERATSGLKRGYKYVEPKHMIAAQLADPLDCLFATSAGGTTGYGGYTGIQTGEYDGSATYAGTPITLCLDVPEIKETFVDPEGNEIPPSVLHSTFVQNNKYYATGNSYSFGGGQNGQATNLPASYIKNGIEYEYLGWYYGDTFKTGNPQFDWKNIADNEKDKFANIKIVYGEKKTMYDITARWVDDTSNANLIDCSAQIGLPNPGTVAQAEGTTFTFNIFGTLSDSSSSWWDIVGWRNMTDDPNTLHPGVNVSVPSVNKNTLLHFVYKKRAARLDVNLLPDSTVIKKSGETIDWTLTVRNTGHMYNVEKLDISHLITQTGGSMSAPTNTVIEDNNGSQITGITNNVWSDGGVELAAQNVKIKPNEKITVKFKTTVIGDTGDLLNLKTIVNSNNNTLSSSDDANVRIKDPDHHEVTDPADSKLSLLYVPTIFGFGQQDKMNIGTTQTMALAPGSYHSKTVSEGFYVKLQDPRNNQSGNNWKLSAQLDYFADSSTNIILTTQPVLTLDNCSTEVVNNPETASENGAPTGDVTLNSPTVILTGGGGTVPIMNSQNTKNKGTWIFRAPFNDVKLQIPADVGEAGRAYKSDLIWTLEDTI